MALVKSRAFRGTVLIDCVFRAFALVDCGLVGTRQSLACASAAIANSIAECENARWFIDNQQLHDSEQALLAWMIQG
jgi:hypothetical protein